MRRVPRGERVPVAPNDDPGPYGSLADIPGHRPLVGVYPGRAYWLPLSRVDVGDAVGASAADGR